MHRQNSIAKNSTYLFVGNFGLKVITATMAIVLTRYLSPEEYGVLSVALALGVIASFLTKMSLTHTIIREGTKPDVDFKCLFGGALRLRLIFSLLATFAFVIFISLVYKNTLLRNIAFIIVIPTIWGGSFLSLAQAYFQVVQRMEFTALLRAIPGILSATLLLLGICLHWPLTGLAFAYGASSIISGVLGVLIVHRLVPGLKGWYPGLLEGLWAFALGGILILLMGQLGPLILERTTDLAQVGYFSVAFRIPALLYTFPGALATAFYPRLFYLGNRRTVEHLELTIREAKYMTLLGLWLSLPFIIYPEWTIKFLFGDKWVGPSSQALTFLAWMVILQCLNYPLADALATRGFQSLRAGVLGGALVLGIPLFWILGKRWGAVGGAVSALVLEFCLLIGFTFINPNRVEIIRHCLVPNFLIVATSFFGGYIVERTIVSKAVGCILIPLLFGSVLIAFDKDVRENLLAFRFSKKRQGRI